MWHCSYYIVQFRNAMECVKESVAHGSILIFNKTIVSEDITMLWNDVVSEVLKRKASGRKTSILSEKECDVPRIKANTVSARKKPPSEKKALVAYVLGAKYGKMYFTKREAECMVFLLKGKTISKVAEALKLSPRTVEYYVKNMKNKIGCRTKFELIDLINASEFIKNIDANLRILM